MLPFPGHSLGFRPLTGSNSDEIPSTTHPYIPDKYEKSVTGSSTRSRTILPLIRWHTTIYDTPGYHWVSFPLAALCWKRDGSASLGVDVLLNCERFSRLGSPNGRGSTVQLKLTQEMAERQQSASAFVINGRTPEQDGEERQWQIRMSLAAAEPLKCQVLVT